METIANYMVHAGLALLVLYLFYRVVLRNQPTLRYNRLFLLVAPVLALIIPLIQLPLPFQTVLPAAGALPVIQLNEIQVVSNGGVSNAATQFITIAQIALVLYSIVGLVLLVKLGLQLFRIHQMAASATLLPSPALEVTVLQTDGNAPAFAFLHFVFLGNQQHLSPKEQQQVLSHELAHVRLRHTYDILYYEILTALLWFNPLIWLLKEELRDVHEYQADAEVLTYYQPQEYSSLLAKEVLYTTGIPVGSYFQKPQVFRRLHMLQQHGRQSSLLRPFLAIPVLLALLITFSAGNVSADMAAALEDVGSAKEQLANSQANGSGIPATSAASEKTGTDLGIATETVAPTLKAIPENPIIEKAGDAGKAQIKKEEPATLPAKPIPGADEKEKPYTYVEQMPEFRGGETEMLRFLTQNMRYPKATEDAGLEGLVVLSFVVKKDGSLHDIAVLKGLHEDADAEAVRVLKSMNGQWTPGRQNGEVVPVRYTLPVRFSMKK